MPAKTPLPTPAGTIASRRAAAKRRAQPAETTSAPRQRRSLAEMVRNPVGMTPKQHLEQVAHAAAHCSDDDLRHVARNGASETVRTIAAQVLSERGGVVGNGKMLAGAKPSKSKADKVIAKAVKAAAKTPEAANAARKAAIEAGERVNAERLVKHVTGYGPVLTQPSSWLGDGDV